MKNRMFWINRSHEMAGIGLTRLKRRFLRKKVLSDDAVVETDLKRCLTTFDLVVLGVGCTLGAGLYVVSGQVAREKSGPSIIISFLIAAVASAFAGLCYAEFAARIPRAGSAYIYSYVTVGELMAFIIGWNLILEYVIGAASVARGLSDYIDQLVDHKISHTLRTTMHLNVASLSSYPDFLAFFISLVVTALLGFGVKESIRFNNVFTVINLLVVAYITLCGVFKIDWHNWNLSPHEIPPDTGKGGFMPYGLSGTLAGSATCFYAFVGFDAIATTGEETKNPQKSIPIAIIISLLIIFISYFCVSGVMTLMVPYYVLDPKAPLPDVFLRVGWGVARYIISVGAIAGLCTSLLGSMFPLPRVLYAMGTDGVIFKFMGKVSPRFQTPLIGTIVSGVFSGLMAMFFNLTELVDMMSIGTFLAYTLVAICVLILRYETSDNNLIAMSPDHYFKFKNLLFPNAVIPSPRTSLIVKLSILILCIDITALSSILSFATDRLHEGWAIFLIIIFIAVFILCLVVIVRQPQSSTKLSFKVPFLPYLPVLSCFINIFLMLNLSTMTWVRFGIWLIIGFVIYGICVRLYPMESKTSTDGVILITSESSSSLTSQAREQLYGDNSSLTSSIRSEKLEY